MIFLVMLEYCDEKVGFQHEKLEIYQDCLNDFMSKVDADFPNHHLVRITIVM